MKKIICFIFGHRIKTEQCPFTKAKLDYCTRCNHGKRPSHTPSTFN